MGLVLLLATWALEGFLGLWCCYAYWTFTVWSYKGFTLLGPGYAFLRIYGWLPISHRYPLTQHQIALFFVGGYLLLHVGAMLRGASEPLRIRTRLGIRLHPSVREMQTFQRAYQALERTRSSTPLAPTLKAPRRWQVRDADEAQLRFIGQVLVIDRDLLNSRHFVPLLAHELGHVTSGDLLIRSMLALLPPARWAVLTLLGLPNACGPLLLALLWAQYWRGRVYAADEYAARIGQRYALIEALDRLRRPFDRASSWGRLLRETPYVESRIDRLLRYQEPPVQQQLVAPP